MSVPRERLAQDGAEAKTAIKWVLTRVALTSTAMSGWKGAKQQLWIAQWVTSAPTAVLTMLCNQQIEQRLGQLLATSDADQPLLIRGSTGACQGLFPWRAESPAHRTPRHSGRKAAQP